MKKFALVLAAAALVACGAEGDPVPQFGLGIGPRGITPRVVVTDPETGARVGATPGNVSAGAGPVSIGL